MLFRYNQQKVNLHQSAIDVNDEDDWVMLQDYKLKKTNYSSLDFDKHSPYLFEDETDIAIARKLRDCCDNKINMQFIYKFLKTRNLIRLHKIDDFEVKRVETYNMNDDNIFQITENRWKTKEGNKQSFYILVKKTYIIC